MTKKKTSIIFLGFILIFFGAIVLMRSFFSGNEDLWICDNGTWVKHGNPTEPMPAVPCEENGQKSDQLFKDETFKKVSFEDSQKIAENFASLSPTYQFDGSSLKLDASEALRCPSCWKYDFSFESKHAGYGDRKDKLLAQVITLHKLSITVKEGEVIAAVSDGTYDEINNKFLK